MHFQNLTYVNRGAYGIVASAYDPTLPPTEHHPEGKNNVIIKKIIDPGSYDEFCKVCR